MMPVVEMSRSTTGPQLAESELICTERCETEAALR